MKKKTDKCAAQAKGGGQMKWLKQTIKWFFRSQKNMASGYEIEKRIRKSKEEHFSKNYSSHL